MKQFFNYIFNFYIFSNLHVALSVVSLYLIFNNKININYLFFLFLGTIVSYNLMRLISFGSNRFFYKKFLIRNKEIFVFLILVSILLGSYFFWQLPIKIKIYLIPIIIISIFYNFDYKYAPIPALRNNGILKVLIVAFSWSILSVVIPGFMNQYNTRVAELWVKAGFVFIYILMLTISFDQRDILVDHAKLKTFPRLFGKQIIYFYLLFFILLSFINYALFDGKFFYITTLILIISVILCVFSTEKKSFYYTAFWIEALPVFWWILLQI